MLDMKGRGWCSRLVTLAAASFLFLGLLDHPVKADIYVSDLITNTGPGHVLRFDEQPPHLQKQFLDANRNPISIGGGEGIVCLTVGGVPKIFVSDNTNFITVYDLSSGSKETSDDLGGSVGALSLSLDGSVLYAGVYGANPSKIVALDATQSLAGQTPLSYVFDSNQSLPNASHDVRVGPDGMVYATDFQHNTGVLRFTRQLGGQPAISQRGVRKRVKSLWERDFCVKRQGAHFCACFFRHFGHENP